MKDVVNAQVKRREGFRPFAPSVLDERGREFFDGYATNPFMLLVLPVRKDKRDVIPAVTHVDGTGRLQSVTRDFNRDYHRLITEFNRLTGVPVVLNTRLQHARRADGQHPRRGGHGLPAQRHGRACPGSPSRREADRPRFVTGPHWSALCRQPT